jgi:chitodextrinase
VTDAWGLKDTKSLLLDPQTVSLNFDTVPSGLQLVVGGDSSTTPLTKSVILGSNNLIAAVTPQNPSGTTLNFVSWSDGGNQSHFVLGNATATYIATYSQAGDTIAPSAPAALVANAISGTQIVLNWPAATDNIGVTGYEVERCQGVGCTIFALVATPTTTNFSETGVTPNTSYSYRVRSRDAVGNFSPYTPLSTTTTFANLIDTFDRADNLNLGPAWDPYTGHSALQILNNSIRATTVNADNVESYNAVPLPANQWSQATLTGWSGTTYHNAHIAVRLSNTLGSLTGYSGFVESRNQAVIGKWTAGVFSPLATAPYTPKPGDLLRLEAEGAVLRFWVNNVQILTTNDTNYSSGRPGLAIYIDAGGTTDQVTFDNFVAGEWTSLTEWQQVDAMALNQVTQSQGQGILLVGDSLTNRNPLTTLCDRPVIRAGYEGGTWHDVKLRPIWPTVQAQTALVLLGTNDAFKTFPLDAAWLAEVQSFLSTLHAHANQVFLVLPPPILPGPNTTPAAIQRIQEIATLLSALGEQTVDARVIQSPADFTDGIHLSASGYALLNSLYGAAACPASDTTPPDAPAALTATPLSETQMAVSWPAATDNVGVTGYEVERCQGAGCTSFALIATPSTPSFGDAGLTANTTYRYQVRARDAAGLVSLYSPIATATTLTPDTTLPLVAMTAPADGASVAGLVTVSATASDNVGVVGVQFLLDGSPLGAEDLTAPYTLSWNTTTVVNGTHTLAAQARDAAGNPATAVPVTVTVFNAVDTTPPTAPATLTATPVSGTQITLSWPAATDNVGVTGYDVERCQGASCTTFALIATPSTLSFGDAGLTLGTTYRYQVRARDAVGLVSLYSPIATATTLAATDNFDRADNPQLGAAWDPYTSYSPLQLLGNSVRASAVNTDSMESYNAVALPPDQWAQATLTGWNGTAYHNAHVNVRLSATPAVLNGYAGLVTSTNKALIAKWTNNALTELAFVPYTPAIGDVLRLEAEGTTLRFYVNNVLRVTATDASYPSGRPGLTIYLDAAAALSQVQLDNFSANSF